MANQTNIIDIDSKFLDNLKAADKALQHSAMWASNMSREFVNMVNQTGSLKTALSAMGGAANAKFDKGFLQMNTSARNAVDAVNSLSTAIANAKTNYGAMVKEIGSRVKPVKLSLLKQTDLQDIEKLKSKISDIDTALNKERSKPLSAKTISALVEFKAFYQQTLNDILMTDNDRTDKQMKNVEKIIKAKKREAKAAQEAYLTALSESPKAAIGFAKNAPNTDLLLAKKVLKNAMFNSNDINTTNELTKTLAEVEDRINKLNGKDINIRIKNDVAITKSANDVRELNDAISRLQQTKYLINPKTSAGEGQIKKIEDAIARAQKKIEDFKAKTDGLMSNPNKAIQFAKNAVTEGQLKDAEKVLLGARGRVDPKEVKTLGKINKELDIVRGKLNDISGKSLEIKIKSDSKIASQTNDVDKLREAIIRLEEAKKTIDANTPTGSRLVSDVDIALEKARQRETVLKAKNADKTQTPEAVYRAQRKEIAELEKALNNIRIEDEKRVEYLNRIREIQGQINQSTIEGVNLHSRTNDILNKNELLMTSMALKRGGTISADNGLGAIRASDKSGTISVSQVENLIRETNDVNTLKEAYRALYEAKQRWSKDKTVSQDSEQIQKLNELMTTTKQKIKDVNEEKKRLTDNIFSVRSSMSSLQGLIARVFAVQSVVGFTNKVVALHGRFETLRRALTILVKDSERANLVWNKITRLAVKSPFTIHQLADATKQMAAYRIESDKLYEKTKMLADISAGLGVEMNRLILAYGQVKAANFLRATELRQFSEAGIDMLGQLATYFSQLEGRLVSAADVFERISKRQVMFEDVDAVLQRVTERGGAFYGMQEEMAKTTAGQLSNLKDQLQLVYDEIGTKNHETIHKVIKVLRLLAQNIDLVVTVGGTLLALFAMWKTAMLVNTVITKTYAAAVAVYTAVTLKAATATERLTKATKRFNIVSKFNPIIAVVSVIGVAAGAIFGLESALNGLSSASDNSNESLNSGAQIMRDIAKAFSSEAENRSDLANRIQGLTKDINALTKEQEAGADVTDELNYKLRERGVLLSSLGSMTSEYASELAAVLGDEEAMAEVIEKNNRRLANRATFGYATQGLNRDEMGKHLQAEYARNAMPSQYAESGHLNLREYLDPNGFIPDKYWDEDGNIREDMRGELMNFYEDLKKHAGIVTIAAAEGRTMSDLRDQVIGALTSEYVQSVIDTDHMNQQIVKKDYGGAETRAIAIELSERLALVNSGTEGAPRWGEILPLLYDEENKEVQTYIEEAASKLENALGDEVIKALSDTTDTEKQEEAQRAVQEYLNSLFAEAEWAPEELSVIHTLIGNELDFTWKDFQPALKSWQKNYNTYVQGIRESLKEDGLEDRDVSYSLLGISSGDMKTEDLKKNLEDELKEQEEIIAVYENWKKENDMRIARGETPFDGMYSEEDYQIALKNKPATVQALEFLGGMKNKDVKGVKDTVKAITDVHKAYKDLQKDFEDPVAAVGAWEKYGDALSTALEPFGMSIDNFKAKFGDLTSESEMLNALEWLKGQLEETSDIYDVQRAMGDITWELKLENQREAAQKLNDEIEELFTGYSLSIELDKLNIPKDFAQQFFDIDVTDASSLRKELMSRKGEFVGTDQEKKYNDFLEKVDEMEIKEQQERLKKYLEFTRDNISERGKIVLEEYMQMQDIAKAFALTDTLAYHKDIITKEQLDMLRETGTTMESLLALSDEDIINKFAISQETIDSLRTFNEELLEQRDIAESRTREETAKKLTKHDFEVFKSSDVFETLYGDMENTSVSSLNILISKLEEHSDQWKDMPLDEVRGYVDLLYEAREALMLSKAPREAIRMATAQLQGYNFNGADDASTRMADAEMEIERLNKQLSIVENIESLRTQEKTDVQIINELHLEDVSLLWKSSKYLKEQRATQTKIVDDAKGYLNTLMIIERAYEKQRERIQKVKELVDKVLSGWESVNAVFGDDTMSTAILEMTRGVSDAAFGMAEMVSLAKQGIQGLKTAAEGAKSFGAAMNAASGIIGVIVMGIQAVSAIVKFAFEQHDKNIQKQIDAETDKVENLQKAYEDLEKQIEKAYSSNNLADLTGEASRNLQEQIAATERMIALEEDKKKSDEDTIKGWKDDVDALNDRLEELKEQIFSTLTDGILDDVLGATRTFVDAWHDAYEETGEGMIGLEETFTDMLRNMLRQQASMQLISPFVNKYKEWLAQYVGDEDDPNLTAEEARAWADRVKATFPEVNELLKGFFEGTQGLLETNSELSDLEKGIQGMTEDQAEVLAAYWNSCRFTLTNIDMTLSDVADRVLGQSANGDAVLNELKAQTGVLRDIWAALDSVIGIGGNTIHAGSYIKVNM